MKRILFAAGACAVLASCSKKDETDPTPPVATSKGSWMVGANTYKAKTYSIQYGAGLLSVFDSVGHNIKFSFPDTSVTPGTYTIVRVPASGSQEMGIIVSDQNGSGEYQTTGSDRVNAVVTRSSAGLSVSVPTCRISQRFGGTDSTTLSVAIGPL